MIAPFKQLLGLKQRKQLNALKALQIGQGKVLRARQIHAQATDAVHASTAGYAKRVDALYAPILGRTIDLINIEEIENKIAQLDLDHQALVEAEQDALDRMEELEEAQTLLSSAYQTATRSCEKFRTLYLILEEQAQKTAERLEEMELEEGFGQYRERLI